MNEQNGFMSERKGLKKEEGLDLQHIGNYDLVRRIDVGGMGEVYLAHQRSAFGREVAVKIIRSDLINDAMARQRFLREAEVASYLKHDHILPLLEFGEVDGRLFIVTPYIKDGTLAQRLARGSLSIAEVHELFSALCRAVSYLHKRGIVHRDLKPGNILLDTEEDSGRVYVRLIDFGIAASQGILSSGPLPTTGRQMGTADYIAPERLREVDGRAAPSNDIYSLGVMLHVMLTGELPRPEAIPHVPMPLVSVIERCLESEPEDRFASVDDLLMAFEHAYKSLTTSQQTGTVSVSPEVLPSRLSPAPPSIARGSSSPELPLALDAVEPTARLPIDSEEVVARASVMRRSNGQEPASRPPIRRHTGEEPGSRPERRGVSGEYPRIPSLPARQPLPPREGVEQKMLASSATDTSIRVQPARPARVSSVNQGTILPPNQGSNFQKMDYDAPTAELDPELIPRRRSAQVERVSGTNHQPIAKPTTAGKGKKVKKGKAKRGSAVVALFFFSIAIILAILGITYWIFMLSITATVTISPRVKTVSNVFTLVAQPKVKSIDVGTHTLPANVFTSSQQNSAQGRPSGTSGCILGIFECKQTVSLVDVSTLAAQLRPGLRDQLALDLKKQARVAGATMVGDIFYADGPITANPPVGTVSKTVTISVTEQGSVEYFKPSDVQTLALQMLKQKVGQGNPDYTLIDAMTRIGQPVIRGIDANGFVTIAVSTAGVTHYKISDAEIATIKNHLKGTDIKHARAILLAQTNFDPDTISVRLSYGDNVPTNIQQIKMIVLNPTTIPTVQLPPVPAAKPGT